MNQNKYTSRTNTLLMRLLLLAVVFWSGSDWLQAQATIRVRVVQARVLNNLDCDGFLNDSDFVWEFIATDNTIGRSNNSPSALGGLLGDFNHCNFNGENGPYTISPSTQGNFNPNDGIYFQHNYVCPLDVPSQVRVDWQAYENDDLIFNYSLLIGGIQGGTGPRVLNMLVPAVAGSVQQTVQATSGDPTCPQIYEITYEITRINLSTTPIPDNICDATQIPVDGVVRQFAWCPDATLEVGEPRRGDVANNRSRWFYFVAPASGRIDISTDHGGTDFGTYFEIYHAADGAGCTAGLSPFGVPIKNKFEYLSHVDFADAGGFLGTSSQADINFDDCANILTSNPLVAGEVYYIQMTTDDAGQRGFIDISISNLGGSPAEPWDIPCRGTNVTVGTAVRSSGAGSPANANISIGCATSRETGNFYGGTDPEQFRAYDYNHPATNNGTIHESTWARFTAPNSGRIFFEGGMGGLLASENTALFGFDGRFSPGRPADYSCGNLTVLAAAEGGTGALGANPTAIITQSCLEPGYTYYGMIDPPAVTTSNTAEVWFYDPSVTDPQNNPPGNDILCLALTDTLYRVPVVPVDSVIPFAAVAGSNVRACRERLAGEPASNFNAAQRADQTVWHYFTAPASGVADIRLRAYIGMNRLNYAVYPLLNGSDCYGGLRPATFTQNGLPTGLGLQAIAFGQTDFTGTTLSLCCLTPGATYAIQLDGGAPGDEGQYIIEFIREVEVYAGDSRYVTQDGDTINYNSADTAYICFGDSIFPGVMLNPLGVSTTQIPQCMTVGYVLHSQFPTPDPVANVGFVYIDSTTQVPPAFVHDGNGSGTFGNPLRNQVYYVSALADETVSWGRLTCSSASIENGAPVVFLNPITTTQTYNQNSCVFTFSASGGLPQFNGSTFSFVVVSVATGDTIYTGTTGNGVVQVYGVPAAGLYNVFITDGANCETIIPINATPCLDPCINNPTRIQPDPINNSVYTCLPNAQADVTLQLTGGAPTLNGSDYTVIVSGSTVAGANGTFTHAPVGGVNPTPYTFRVNDGDAWQVIIFDANNCRDTAVGTFTYNSNTCPNFCSLNPFAVTTNYNCITPDIAIVEVTVGGGLPAVNGSPYFLSVSGSTVFGQTFNNAQLAGVVGGTTTFSFIVNDGDAWQLIVNDTASCADTTTGTYLYNIANCPNFCTLTPVVVSPDPITSAVYTCNPDGTATVTLSINGGTPTLDPAQQYTVVVSGSTVAGANGTFTSGIGNFTFLVNDTDNWQFIASDVNTCADTAIGIFSLLDCPNFCQLRPMTTSAGNYFCYLDQTATVTITIGGGAPSLNGTDYTVVVVGSTAGSNTTGTPIAGVANGTVDYVITVTSGDSWQVFVTDDLGCTSAIQGMFLWNASNCANICQDPNFPAITINGGGGIQYDCDGQGAATLTLTFAGGLPQVDTGATAYVAAVTINGTTTSYNVASNGSQGTVTIGLANGDEWSLLVWDQLNCDSAEIASTIFTTVNAVAETDATSDLLVGEFANLIGTNSTGGNISYSWTPTDRVDNPTAATTPVQPLQTTIYTLEVTDTLGCTDTDTVEVRVGACVPLHAGFTPNADGVNDTWVIPCLTLFDNEVQVYNRWGQLVFTMVNYDGSWNGTSSGQDLPAATYYYVINVTYPGLPEPILYKGTVTILR